jgi:hypothetical protein
MASMETDEVKQQQVEDETLNNVNVQQKYKFASDIANGR